MRGTPAAHAGRMQSIDLTELTRITGGAGDDWNGGTDDGPRHPPPLPIHPPPGTGWPPGWNGPKLPIDWPKKK